MSVTQDKHILKFQKAVNEQQYYEAHQFLRMIVNRHVKTCHYEQSVELLYAASKQLLEVGQLASGDDLALYMVNVYDLMKQKPDIAAKARILDLLRLYGPEESIKKRFIKKVLAWSSKWGNTVVGDSDLHHSIGMIWAQEGNLFEAEKHFVLGTNCSLVPLMNLIYEYFDEDALSTAPFYISRVVFPYLMLYNMAGAVQAYQAMTRHLIEKRSVTTQTLSSSIADMIVFPTLPLMNFLYFLILTCQREAADLFNMLKIHYAEALKQATAWQPSLDKIAEIYFHIGPPQAPTHNWADWMRQWFGDDDPSASESAPHDSLD